jgi:hypothetical protein
MDFLPIAVLILFVLLGGGIAVFADELGRRIGKKRLSLGRRFRPKTTARIITFISGCMITFVTMLLIGLSSSDMRTLLLRGRRAIEEAQARSNELRIEQKRLTDANKGLDNRNRYLTSQILDLTTRLTLERSKLTNSEAKLKGYEGKLAAAKAKADREAARVATLDKKASGLEHQLASVNSELRDSSADLLKRKNELVKLQQKYDYVSNEYTGLLKYNQTQQVQKDELEKQVQAKAQEVLDANLKIGELQERQRSLQGEIDDNNSRLEKVRSALAQAQQQQETIEFVAAMGAIHARFDGLMFPKGEELGRIMIPSGTSKNQVFDKIEAALVLAKETAKERGASETWNGIKYADMIEMPDDQGRKVAVQTQKNVLASELAGASEDQVLIVWAYVNAFANESVVVTFSHFANPLVYTTGQTLAEIRVDGRQEPAKILKSLNELGPRIRSRALSDKMIPIQKGDMSLGSVSAEDILLLVRQIQDSGGSVRVRARAKRQTRAADPLELDFEVR